jgi:hypothetical protein
VIASILAFIRGALGMGFLALLALGMYLSVAWPVSAREQFAAQVAHDMCRPPHSCPVDPPSAAPPLIQALAAPSGPGVVYSAAQMEAALVAAGVPEPSAHVGAAVGMAESRGRSDAECDSCAGVLEDSVGPWQENLLAHPWLTRACAMALDCAARAAARISGGGRNWSAWSDYVNGAWRAFA